MGFLGVISDTHGLVRPAALAALRGAELVVHAGDVGSAEVLAALRELAPVVAVRGNNDVEPWASELADTAVVRWRGRALYLLHDVKELAVDPRAEGCAAVISGHSHRPKAELANGVLWLDPGSAGPRRFRLPVAVARVHEKNGELEAEIVELAV